jgi:hypothetical protein
LTQRPDEAKVIYKHPRRGKPALLDPCAQEDNPENHLTYILDDVNPLFGQVIPRDNSRRGERTIAVTGIADEFFFRARQRRALEVLQMSYALILRAANNRRVAGPRSSRGQPCRQLSQLTHLLFAQVVWQESGLSESAAS